MHDEKRRAQCPGRRPGTKPQLDDGALVIQMSHMKTATVRELRNDFGKLSKWLSAGETIQIVKRGQPFARMVPEPMPRSFLGAGVGTMKLPPDVDAPVGVEWEAMR